MLPDVAVPDGRAPRTAGRRVWTDRHTMHALRSSAMLARLVLAWFILALGVAVASPIVQPKAMELVCSAGGGVKLVALAGDDETAPVGQHLLDCPMCLAVATPWPEHGISGAAWQPLAHALTPAFAAHIAALVGAPLPARGPPQRS